MSSDQEALAKYMKDIVFHISSDVNNIQCMKLQCRNCLCWKDHTCGIARITDILTECLQNRKLTVEEHCD